MLRRPADTSTAEITLTKRWWRAVVRAVRRGEAWPGTRYERAALQRAITRYCSCGVGRMGVRVFDCPSHRLLGQPEVLKRLTDRRALART